MSVVCVDITYTNYVIHDLIYVVGARVIDGIILLSSLFVFLFLTNLELWPTVFVYFPDPYPVSEWSTNVGTRETSPSFLFFRNNRYRNRPYRIHTCVLNDGRFRRNVQSARNDDIDEIENNVKTKQQQNVKRTRANSCLETSVVKLLRRVNHTYKKLW